MYIKSIEISNYKSFNKPQFLQLSRGINIVIGKNNVGKTTVLEALTFQESNPHINVITKPRANAQINDSSVFRCKFIFDPNEFKEYVSDNQAGKFCLSAKLDQYLYTWREPQPEHLIRGGYYKFLAFSPDDIDDNSYFFDGDEVQLQEITQSLVDPVKRYFEQKIIVTYDIEKSSRIYSFENLYKSPIPENHRTSYLFEIEQDNFNLLMGPKQNESRDVDVAVNLVKYFVSSAIYKFDIYRIVPSKSNISNVSLLKSDCSNLPAVLAIFQRDRLGFQKYVTLVKEIFPDIHDVIIDINSTEAEIKIWNVPPIENRYDLAIPLNHCGTGVAQILAILYLVVSSTSQVIIIDEPNSFLHPSASRKLMNIFKRYPKHQYILSTHSPEIIASNPDNLILLTLENGETRVKVLEKRQKQDIHDAMKEIGFKLSDVYGYDSILWVEGPTEQACFPKIISMYYPKLEGNMAIVAVRHTGDFEKKYIDTTYALYEKISSSGSKSVLIPPAVAFVFDREGKSEKEITDWKRGREKIHFTEVRLYENYILDEDAIASILNTYSTEYEWGETYTIEEIKKWLDSNKTDNKYWDNKAVNNADAANWKDQIHAAKLLEDLFREFTDHKVSYQKTVDSVKLTEYLLENKPEAFDSLKQLLDKFLPK